RLRAPRERQVWAETVSIAGIDARNLSSLPVKVAAQLSRYINHAPATAVVTHVHQIVFDPHVVRAAFRHRILRDFPRIVDVRDVHHVDHTAHRNAFRRSDIEYSREHLVADEDVVAITIDRMCARQPTVAVKLVVIETKLTDKLRILRTAAFYSRADVEYHEAIVPVSEIRKTVLDL